MHQNVRREAHLGQVVRAIAEEVDRAWNRLVVVKGAAVVRNVVMSSSPRGELGVSVGGLVV